MATQLEETLRRMVNALQAELADNLYSCCVYGSAVRGNAIEGLSDINLLVLLNQSDAAAHEAISRAIGSEPTVDPFVLTRRGFERSERAFATKFASIKRNYRVLHGADPLATLKVDPKLEKFLCEQAIRNLRLRLVFSFITRQRHKAYDKFVIHNITTMFVQFSEALRLDGVVMPHDFQARAPIFEKAFSVDGRVFTDLLSLKQTPHAFSDAEAVAWHERIFPVVDSVVNWIETHWPAE